MAPPADSIPDRQGTPADNMQRDAAYLVGTLGEPAVLALAGYPASLAHRAKQAQIKFGRIVGGDKGGQEDKGVTGRKVPNLQSIQRSQRLAADQATHLL